MAVDMDVNARTVAEVAIAAPRDVVWRALREPPLIARWFGWEYDGLAEEIDQIFVREAVADEAAGTLDWPGGDWIATLADGPGSIVRITRTAPAPPDGWDALGEGWLSFAHALRFALERHPGEDRRSLYRAGAPRAPGRTVAAAAGLPEPSAQDIWMRSEHQLAIVLDEGLVVLTRRPAAPGTAPHDTLTLIAHGIAPDAWAALAERVAAGWAAGHDADAR